MAKAQDGQALTIDGKPYRLSDLSDNAKAQMTSLNVTDKEISHLQQRLAICQTARKAYARALSEDLPKSEH